MSLNINHVTIAGNLTRDPETRFIKDDRAVCNFGIAVNRKFKGADGELKEDVTFVDVEAWGRTAELVGQYLKKGSPAYIEGRLKLDAWEKDGQKFRKLAVVADSVQFLSGKTAGDPAPASPAPQANPQRPAAATQSSEEPPF